MIDGLDEYITFIPDDELVCPECENINYVLDGGDGSLCQNEFHSKLERKRYEIRKSRMASTKS